MGDSQLCVSERVSAVLIGGSGGDQIECQSPILTTCVNALSKPSWPEHLGGKRGKLQPERQFGGEVVAALA